jgi:hypothetical protein
MHNGAAKGGAAKGRAAKEGAAKGSGRRGVGSPEAWRSETNRHAGLLCLVLTSQAQGHISQLKILVAN